MNSKLTRSIEEQVIAAAKAYAKEQGRSLSSIVEEYLKSIANQKKIDRASKFHPLVENLCGAVKIPSDQSYDEILGIALIEKNSKR